jgi:transposase-like protein
MSRFSKAVGTSWRVDETYISIKAKWHYLYRAVDKHGKTVDFLLRPASQPRTGVLSQSACLDSAACAAQK